MRNTLTTYSSVLVMLSVLQLVERKSRRKIFARSILLLEESCLTKLISIMKSVAFLEITLHNASACLVKLIVHFRCIMLKVKSNVHRARDAKFF